MKFYWIVDLSCAAPSLFTSNEPQSEAAGDRSVITKSLLAH